MAWIAGTVHDFDSKLVADIAAAVGNAIGAGNAAAYPHALADDPSRANNCK
jgi:hypothetical protein